MAPGGPRAAGEPEVVTPPVTTVGLTVWVALTVVYVVWGSTYLGIRVVVTDGLPPLVSMGSRFVVAALLLAAVLAVRSGPRRLRVTRRELAGASLVGLFLLLGGNGMVAVAEQDVPSALAALLVATTPLWLVGFRFATGDRPRWMTWAGTALGFVGIAVLARPGGHEGDVPLAATLLVVLATFLWATGSFASGRLTMPADPFVASVWQMGVAGAAMVAAGSAAGELPRLAAAFDGGAPARGLVAWAYLVVFGSLLAYTAYYWLLRNAPISLVATYAYVNPVVAVVLGWLVLAEPVTATVVLGGGLAVLGVLVVVRSERRRPLPAAADAAEDDAPR
ncbi:EamA family transporter [Thalassiella azotivora]